MVRLGQRGKRYLAAALVSLALGATAWSFEAEVEQSHQQEAKNVVLNHLATVRARLEGSINSNLLAFTGLTAEITHNPGITQARFAQLAETILEQRTDIRNIGAARDLVITHMYPLEGNEKAIGLDYRRNDAQKAAVLRVMDLRGVVIAGPVNLVQGGSGFIARAPIYVADPEQGAAGTTFWGLLSAVIDSDALFKAAGLQGSDAPIAVAIRGHDSSGAAGDVFFGEPQVFGAEPVLLDVILPNGSWQMAGIPVGGWPQAAPETPIIRIAVLLAILTVIVLAVYRDKLARKETRIVAALSESERNYQAIVEDQAEMISRHAPDGARTFVNEAYGRFHGKSKEELLGRSAYEGMDPGDLERLEAIYAELSPENPTGEFVVSFPGPDGETVWQNWTKRVIYDSQGRVAEYQAVGRDITREKQAEARLSKALDAAREANAAKSRFLATISHELRTPLNAIIGFSDFCSNEYLGKNSPKYREYAQDIHASGEYLLSLVNDLLDVTAIDGGRRDLDRQTSDLSDLIRETVTIAKHRSQDKDQTLALDLAAPNVTMKIDRRAIKQVLLNVIGNAQKFTPAHGAIQVTLSRAGDQTRITVADNGEGIPADELQTVTDLFTRGKRDPFHSEEGWGLGLAISKSLVEMHGGDLTIESEIGRGTTVTIVLPNDAPNGAPNDAPGDSRAA